MAWRRLSRGHAPPATHSMHKLLQDPVAAELQHHKKRLHSSVFTTACFASHFEIQVRWCCSPSIHPDKNLTLVIYILSVYSVSVAQERQNSQKCVICISCVEGACRHADPVRSPTTCGCLPGASLGCGIAPGHFFSRSDARPGPTCRHGCEGAAASAKDNHSIMCGTPAAARLRSSAVVFPFCLSPRGQPSFVDHACSLGGH